MKLTGQPLVDVGMAIAAQLQGKKSLDETSSSDLCSAVELLTTEINPDKTHLGVLNRLSILAAYWQNNPLMGKNPGKLAEYSDTLHSLTNSDTRTLPGCCQVCGTNGVFSDANRSWFPLAGSAESDPCSLPGLRGKYVCANCFRAVVLLPLGCKFCKAGPYLFHLADPSLQVEAVRDGYEAIRMQRLAHANGNQGLRTPTKLSGRLELLEIVTGSRLWDRNQGGLLSRKTAQGATIISFSNSGTSAAWNQLHLPAQALDFFAALTESQRKDIFLNWAEKSASSVFDGLCSNIEARRSIAPVVFALVRSRKEQDQKLLEEEKQVLQIYENVALGKGDRFDLLERMATRINEMELRYRNSFVKQLGNTRSKDRLLQLLREFAQSDRTGLRLSASELRIIDLSPANEIINLLYLLCVAED